MDVGKKTMTAEQFLNDTNLLTIERTTVSELITVDMSMHFLPSCTNSANAFKL